MHIRTVLSVKAYNIIFAERACFRFLIAIDLTVLAIYRTARNFYGPEMSRGLMQNLTHTSPEISPSAQPVNNPTV